MNREAEGRAVQSASSRGAARVRRHSERTHRGSLIPALPQNASERSALALEKKGRMMFSNMAPEGPEHGRLAPDLMEAFARDDVDALNVWLQVRKRRRPCSDSSALIAATPPTHAVP